MAGGGLGETTPKTTQAAPVPSGLSLDGSPKFEAAAPVSAASGTPSTPPTAGVLPAQPPGTNLMGMPSWMSMFFGGQMGGAPTTPTTGAGRPSNYAPFVPGTNLGGYGMPRDRVIYQPPPKPVPATPDPSKGSMMGIPEYYDFSANPNYALYAGIPGFSYNGTGIKPPTKEQIAMQQWLDNDARNRALAASQAANANGNSA